MVVRCVAFDCFGTVFDMAGVPRDEIRDYSRHVKQRNFTPYVFPVSWRRLKAHSDAAEGIRQLQSSGVVCVAFSNGSVGLIRGISKAAGISWDQVIDLVKHKVYKPSLGAYDAMLADVGFEADEVMMVTANPDFGDVEGAKDTGMRSCVIRNGGVQDILDLADVVDQMNGW